MRNCHLLPGFCFDGDFDRYKSTILLYHLKMRMACHPKVESLPPMARKSILWLPLPIHEIFSSRSPQRLTLKQHPSE